MSEEERVNKREPILVIVLIAIAVLIALITAHFTFRQTDTTDYVQVVPSVPPPVYIAGKNFTVPYENPIYNPLTNDYRPRYKNLTDTQYKNIFGDLPPFPKNFYTFLKAYYEGKISDISRLSENYWKQPEFYGFDQKYVDKYYVPSKRNANLWTPRGFGIFPGIACRGAKPGTTITVNFFIHVSPGVEACQVIELVPTIPQKVYNVVGDVVFTQSTEKVSKYFDVKILNKDEIYTEKILPNLEDIYKIPDSHGIMLLPPTLYWIDNEEYGFPPEYLQKVDMQIKISPNTPKGRYAIALNITEPNDKVREEFYWLFLDTTKPDYQELVQKHFYYAKDIVFGTGEYKPKYWFELILDIA